MFALECMKKRMSVRKFLDRDIPDEILLEILEYASNAPSFKNSQPWEVYVVKEPILSVLSDLLIKEFMAGNPPTPLIKEPDWPEKIRDRINRHITTRAKVFGVDINDKESIKNAKLENYRFYNAPAAIFVFCENSLSEWSVFDLGAFVYGITLAATAKGLGTVIQASLADYPHIIKKVLNVPDNLRLIVGISIGYTDESNIANSYKSTRIPVSEFVRFVR
ncbi:MAG: nitroreductase [Deltaproteobacteria bacterium]|nr:nitroreductase [Deltaproteobacteria bacterium]